MTQDELLMLGDAHRQLHRLNDWERGFIIGLWDKDDGYQLSEKQANCLRKINAKLTID